jgi:hypothetical protein
MKTVDCSLTAYANEFANEMNQCLKSSPGAVLVAGEAACISFAALQAIKNMKTKCSADGRSPDCTPSGYVDAVLEKFDPQTKAMKIGFGKVKKALDKQLGGILPPPHEVIYVTVGGCAIGGVLGGIGGAAATPTLPILGGGFGLVKGCEYGAKVGMGLYGLWKISVKVGGIYEATGTAIDILKTQSNACASKPIFPEINPPSTVTVPQQNAVSHAPLKIKSVDSKPAQVDRVSSTTNSMTLIHARITPPPQQVNLPDRTAPGTTIPSSAPIPQHSLDWIDIEGAADKIVEVAGDITGINHTVHEAKELKRVFTTILSDPEQAPKLLTQHLLKEPERILQRIVDAPEEFLAKTESFLTDPTLGQAVSIIGTAYAIISVANEILPIATRIKREAFKNPIDLPVVVTKELVNLTINKIVGVVELMKGFLKDPFKTSANLIKGIIKSPKYLVKNVKSFLGKGKSKAKKAARKQLQLMEEAKQRIQADNERSYQDIVAALPGCFIMARQQWMISETLTPQQYLGAIVEDWKRAHSSGAFNQLCGAFIKQIHFLLFNGHFSQAASLSPTAHSSQPIPPAIFYETLFKYAQSTWSLACEVKIYERNVAEVTALTAQLQTTVKKTEQQAHELKQQVQLIASGPSLADSSSKLQGHIDGLAQERAALEQKGSALAAKLRGKMSPEMVAKLRDQLSKNQ